MSIYLAFDESPPVMVASNLGWSQFLAWAEHLEGADQIALLTNHGWSQDPKELVEELEQVLPLIDNEDVKSVGVEVLSVVRENQGAGVALVTDGMGPDENKSPNPDQRDKAMSFLGETTGGALVRPARQRKQLPKPPRVIGRMKSLPYLTKSEGTCKQGETAANTGCTPASGDAPAQDQQFDSDWDKVVSQYIDEIERNDDSAKDYSAQQVARMQDWHSDYIQWRWGVKSKPLKSESLGNATKFVTSLLNPVMGGVDYVTKLLTKVDATPTDTSARIQKLFDEAAPDRKELNKAVSVLAGSLFGEQIIPVIKSITQLRAEAPKPNKPAKPGLERRRDKLRNKKPKAPKPLTAEQQAKVEARRRKRDAARQARSDAFARRNKPSS